MPGSAITHPPDSPKERGDAFCLLTLPIRGSVDPVSGADGRYRTLRTEIPHRWDTDTAPSGQEYRTAGTPIPHPPDRNTAPLGHRYRTLRTEIPNIYLQKMTISVKQ